ncbi:CLUMA_CG011224, isoform A [Clunio marinus]|uniref:CLUMA_CG011224, isoform A n=1 Tax=Clunio marinus TaxID=568069 RepID=A0A1J1IC95_9DIPT|nr:CLUMA_CG011224, isoform A [Clunio marinus]
MLLKFNSNERSTGYTNGKGKTVKLTSRLHRKTIRIASKPGKKTPGKKISFGKNQKNFHASKNFPPTTTSLCDNSNDSGLGFEESHQHHLSALALTATNVTSNNNINNNNANYRQLSALRYSEVIQSPSTVTQPVQEKSKAKRVVTMSSNNSSRSSLAARLNQSFSLRTEHEDTCNSDDFSSYYAENKSKLGSLSPTDTFYQSSPEKLSFSGSEGSSPVASSDNSSSPLSSAALEAFEVLPSSLQKQFHHTSRDGSVQLQIVTQPEQQHRARYQTEGSRGAVKDRSGNGFPVVKLNGYNKPTTLQVFIGNDVGRVSPHIFYQACKVSGKNSTPCSEMKTEGTMVIEIEMKPENDMTVICDCVGILKERNVDVEHRLGRNNALTATVTRNKKKSTKCRIVFRVKINEDSEFLQVCSNTITCTQPPGVPEICKKSLDSCSVNGGKELFIIGKNFLKDTKVTFVQYEDNRQMKVLWEETVQPDKEYLQQTHLICVVPSYPNSEGVLEEIPVHIYVTSSNKKSELHNFAFTPFSESGSGSFSNSPVSPTPTETITLKTEFIDQTPIVTVINGGEQPQQQQQPQQDVLTSSPVVGLVQTSVPGSVKNMMYGDSPMIDVTGIPNSFVNQETQALIASSHVQDILDGFKMPSSEGTIEMCHIKNEQRSPEQASSPSPPQPPVAMLSPHTPPQQLSPVQQQQVVENFLNMIVQSSVMSDPPLIENHHHLPQDIVLNSPSVVTTTSSVMQPEQLTNSPPTIMINNTIAPALCGEPTMMAVQMVQNEMNTIGPSSIEGPSASSIVSNAVSDATAETQAVVKQMIAQAAAEILSENVTENQTTISNFISNIMPAPEQQQMANTQQLQQMLVQELNGTNTILQDVVKKDEKTTNTTQEVGQNVLINATPVTTTTTSIAQPFSPTTQDLTTMSESDLISFINPSVFM